nr:Wzz/FepE/Etk N-terminal domain-containing protein [uncultured Cellulosilyticum sp.]
MDNIETTLWEVIVRIIHRIPIIILCAILGGGAGYVYTQQHKVYTYTASVSLYVICNTDVTQLKAGINDISAARDMVGSCIPVLESDQMLQKVSSQINNKYSAKELKRMFSYSQVTKTPFFNIMITCKDPDDAILIANAMSEVAPQQLYDVLRIAYVEVVDPAQGPLSPNPTNTLTKILICLVLSALLPILWILIRSLLDTTIHGNNDLKFYYDIPILGEIPTLEKQTIKNDIQNIDIPEGGDSSETQREQTIE